MARQGPLLHSGVTPGGSLQRCGVTPTGPEARDVAGGPCVLLGEASAEQHQPVHVRSMTASEEPGSAETLRHQGIASGFGDSN